MSHPQSTLSFTSNTTLSYPIQIEKYPKSVHMNNDNHISSSLILPNNTQYCISSIKLCHSLSSLTNNFYYNSNILLNVDPNNNIINFSYSDSDLNNDIEIESTIKKFDNNTTIFEMDDI